MKLLCVCTDFALNDVFKMPRRTRCGQRELPLQRAMYQEYPGEYDFSLMIALRLDAVSLWLDTVSLCAHTHNAYWFCVITWKRLTFSIQIGQFWSCATATKPCRTSLPASCSSAFWTSIGRPMRQIQEIKKMQQAQKGSFSTLVC
jgi:hypothetical protein